VSEQHEAETSGEWTPAPVERYVSVWPHTLGDFEKHQNAVATVDAGVLYVWRAKAAAPDKTVPPIKVYAPGYWATFEHVGDYTPPAPPRPQPPAERRPPRTEDPSGMPPGAVGSDLSGPTTGELPRYRDPVEQLDPDLLDAENGDVNHRSGLGILVPRLAPAGFGVPDPGEGGGPDPKAGSPAPTGEDQDDTSASLARFVFGGSWDRPRHWLRARPWRRHPGAQAPARAASPAPTHLLYLAQPKSRIAWWFLAVSLPLLMLVLTTR